MSLDDDLQTMKSFVKEQLEASGEFSIIEPDWEPGSEHDPRGALKKESARHIYVEKKPELRSKGESGKYLILNNVKKMPGPLFGDKLVAASANDIHTIPIIWKAPLTETPIGTHDFFRRGYREEDKVRGKDKYTKLPAWTDGGFRHLPHSVYNRLRNPRPMELDWIPALTGEGVITYQPDSAMLDEMFRQYNWQSVQKWKKDMNLKPFEEKSQLWYDPVNTHNISDFTLVPTNSDLFSKLIRQPTKKVLMEMEKSYGQRDYNMEKDMKALGVDKILAGKMLSVPTTAAMTTDEIKFRRQIGSLVELIQHHPDHPFIENMMESIGYGLKNAPNNLFTAPLLEAYESAVEDYERYQEQKDKFGDKRLTARMTSEPLREKPNYPYHFEFTAKSKSKPDVTHKIIAEIPSPDMDTWKIYCGPTCMGQKYHQNNHWHYRVVKEFLENSMNKLHLKYR